MKRFMLLLAGLLGLSVVSAHAAVPMSVYNPPSVSVSSVTTAGGVATVTITTPTSVGPYSAGQYNYISHIRIEMYATGTLTGGATPTTCTTTALQSLKFEMPTALATGALYVVDMPLDNAIQGTQASNVVITCPSTASVVWNMVVTYYQGQ